MKSVLLFAAISLAAASAQESKKTPELQPEGGVHDFDLKGDGRALFEGVAHAYGLECMFDGDYTGGRPIHFRIQGADYATALYALESATGSIAVPLSGKLFLVASDTPEKRRAVEPYVAVTVDLREAITPQELTEAKTAVQQAIGLEKVGLQAQGNRVVIRGPVSKVIPAQAIFESLMNRDSQVSVELELLEVSRGDLLTYGLDLTSMVPIFNLDAAQKRATALSVLARGGLGAAAFGISGVSASVLAQIQKSSARMLLHTDLRSLNNHPVTFHAGDRYPILTAAYTGGPATPISSSTADGNTPGNPQPPGVFGNIPNPSALVIADLNGDGKADTAVASADGDYVAVLAGNGNGTFQEPATLPTGKGPSAIAQADLNGDGFIDLITADSSSDEVTVLMGNGNGTFQEGLHFQTGSHPAALAIADFNQDGLPDIATANSDSNDVSILIGGGDGTFKAALPVPVGTSPRSVAAGDFDGDGSPDLAVVNSLSNDVWILMSNGDGTFRTGATYATEATPVAVAAEDLNRDGRPDLMVANSGADTVSVFLGAGAGAFASGVSYPAGASPSALVTGDFNLDGLQDAVIANPDGGIVSLLVGLGNGSFQAPIAFHIEANASALATGDLNSDGLSDVVTANSSSNNLSLLLGATAGGFYDGSGTSYPATGGQVYSPLPAFSFEDLGLLVKATPHVNGMRDVTLDIDAEFKLLTGQQVSGIPVISNRKLVTQVRLVNGEWAVIAGLVSASDIRTISGLVWGPLPGVRTRDRSSSEVLILVKIEPVNLPQERVPPTVWLGSESRPRIPM